MVNNKHDATEGSCEKTFCELGGINAGDLSWTERKEDFTVVPVLLQEKKKNNNSQHRRLERTKTSQLNEMQ